MVKIGDTVTYVDPYGKEHNALVTTVFTSGHVGDDSPAPSVNLVYVSTDDSKSDQYGRQIERNTSVPNEKHQHAPGNYWK